MKKTLLALPVCFALGACSKEVADVPQAGQYIYADGTITAAVYLDKSNTVCITIYESGRYVYQELDGTVKQDEKHGYLYAFRGLVLHCTYSSSSEFTAVPVSCQSISLPASMIFRHDNTVLDSNGDGLLDGHISANFKQTNFINL